MPFFLKFGISMVGLALVVVGVRTLICYGYGDVAVGVFGIVVTVIGLVFMAESCIED